MQNSIVRVNHSILYQRIPFTDINMFEGFVHSYISGMESY